MHKVCDLRSCFLLQAFMKGTVKTSFLICFDLVAPTRPVQGILINKKDPHAFYYGSNTTVFLNTQSVKVHTRHGNTFPKVFPLQCLTETTLLTCLQGKGGADLHSTILISKKCISPTFLIPDGILTAGTSEGIQIRSHCLC